MTADSAVSRATAHFERLYAANPDPWNFATSDYERRKYDATIAALGNRRFTNAFEVGCSIGILTRRLAARCDALLAVDVVAAPLIQAAQLCADLPQVSFATLRVPEQWPEQSPAAPQFDLVLLSEMLYFLTKADIAQVAILSGSSLAPGGLALLVNYTEPSGELCDGHEAAEVFIAAASSGSSSSLHLISQHRDDKFRIDLLQKI